eukprot:TRINITY_DN8843_c0_g1_i1.p1 TRINITY_DN8843_c0_g1~~TRINITY_DN8843_c0_g1_i1.p1  ORF type:complete len:232 (+),score=60.22 TRINITY_DN8843_c0_g1_i1:80-775(+)
MEPAAPSSSSSSSASLPPATWSANSTSYPSSAGPQRNTASYAAYYHPYQAQSQSQVYGSSYYSGASTTWNGASSYQVPSYLPSQVQNPFLSQGNHSHQPSSNHQNNTQMTSNGKKKHFVRGAAGETWDDPILNEWGDDDYRIFCGDLGNDVTDEVLKQAFAKYPSFRRARVVRDKKTQKTRGFGFVSFNDPNDFIKALKEMNGKYVGSRPLKLKKSRWEDRNVKGEKQKSK